MHKIQELDSVNCIDNEDLSGAAVQLLCAAQILIELKTPTLEIADNLTTEQQIKAQMQFFQKNPVLVTGIAVLATLERFRVDFAFQQNATQLILQDVAESVDGADAKASLVTETKLTALTHAEAFVALWQAWEKAKPSRTLYEACEALNEFNVLLGH